MSRNHEHQSNLMQQLGAKNEVHTHKCQNSSNDLTASNNFYDNCRNSRGLIGYFQEPITRSLQLPNIPVTAFSQTDLFLV